MKNILFSLAAVLITLASCKKEAEIAPAAIKIQKKLSDDGGDKKDMSGWDRVGSSEDEGGDKKDMSGWDDETPVDTTTVQP